MAHNFKKVQWTAMETLRLFQHKCEVFAQMHHGHAEDFKKDFAVGDEIDVKLPFRPVIRDGMTYTPQNIDRITTKVRVQQPIGSDFDYDTIDKLLNMERGEERVKKEYLEPIALYLAAEVDKRAAQFIAQNTGNITGALGTDPTTFAATSGAVRQRFMELSSISADKGFFVPPAVMNAIKSGSDANLGRFGAVEEIKQLHKMGVVGKADGFEWYESMSLYEHTAGTWNTTNSLASAVDNGGSTLSITCTNGDTFKKGDVIGLASVYRVNPVTRLVTNRSKTMTVTVAEDVTATSTTATVPIVEKLYFSGPNQNISAQPAASATVTLFPDTTNPSGKVGKNGIAFTREAFAGFTLKLPMPDQEEKASQFTDPETGVSLSYIRSFDFDERRWKNRFDVLPAFGRLHADLAAMRILCA